MGLGYNEDVADSEGIVRARTGVLRSWEFPRKQSALEAIRQEVQVEFPGIYLLFQGDKDIYVGETSSIYNRLRTHITAPEEKFEDWDRAVIINDGRTSAQSDFNDNAIRLKIEYYLIRLFKLNRKVVLAQGEDRTLNANQTAIFNELRPQLDFLLEKKGIVTTFEEPPGEERILSDDLRRLLISKGYRIGEWHEKNATINNAPAFIRPGSQKPTGWQITIRGKKEGSFIKCLVDGKGFLIVPRGKGLVIPLAQIRGILDEPRLEDKDTVDVWIHFRQAITLTYKDHVLDVTGFALN
ncbi:MAG: GIY-YIG nuclease family protein [Candidatus Micrarchaeota archaeon]